MTSDSESPLERLVAALEDEDPVVRARGARDLGRRGPAAAPAAGRLVEALRDPEPMVRAMSAAALGKVGREAATAGAVEALLGLLEDPVFPVRFWACDALGRLGGAPDPVLAALRRRLADGHAAVQKAAALALDRLGAPRPDSRDGRVER